MPTRKDKTNVAPIYREQVFIPAGGATLMKQKARPKIAGRSVSSGTIDIVSPEFDLLTGVRGFATLKNLPINITSKNAHKIKDKTWDKLYNAAIDKGDVEEIKRLRNLHFQAKSRNNFIINEDGTPKHLYHATKNKFNSFDLNKAGTGSGNLSNTEGVVYFSPYKEASLDVFRPKKSEVSDFNIMDLYVNNTNPVNVRLSDFIKTWNNKEEFLKLRNAGEGIIAKGVKTPQQYYDEAIKKYLEKQKSGTLSMFDRKPESVKEFMEEQLVDNYTINNPNNIKSAKAITYDVNGNLVPLSKRDNFSINDIRFKYGGRRKAQLGLDIREGGVAIPIANNMFYIDGRKHAAGGVAIGPNNKNGVEVEGGEVVEMINSNHPSVGRQFKAGGQQQTMRVFSSVPFLRGVSPAQLVMEGANPDTVFKAQEEFKDRNRINDDGTTYEVGGKKIYTPSKSIQRQIQETGRITIGGAPTIGGLRTAKYVKGLATAKGYAKQANKIFTKVDNFVNNGLQGLINKHKITPNQADAYKKIYNEVIGPNGVNVPKTASLFINNDNKQMRYGGQDDTKTAALKHLRNKFTIRGDYNGGMFGGAGASSVIMEQPEFITDTITKRYLVPVTQNFNDAFGDAVNAGLNKFMFDNKWYNTKKGNNPNNNSAGAARTQTVYLPVEHKEVRGRKKEFGGSMIYTINGNIKNGLNLRPKAQYGTIDKKDKDTKVGQDGLIYKRAADGEWYTDGTVHAAFKKASPSGLNKPNSSNAKKFNYTAPEPKRVYIDHSDYEEEKETKKIGSLTYEKNESGKWVPASKQSTTTTRDGGRPKDFGMTRTGVNHPNGNYKYHPLTGEKINEIGVVETSEPSVKGTTKVNSKSNSTPRGEVTKTSTPKSATKTTTKGADVKYGTPLKEKKESLYMTGIKNNSITPLRAGMEKIKSPSSTGGGTQSKDGRWVGQYKTTNVGDWIGLGSNLAGSVASYFMTKNAINKMPEPIKPIMAQAAKLKTRYNVEPQLTNISEAEQMNRATVRRNTQSSNTSLAREQRLMNEARGARNTLYGQKENIETQLINQDRLNRQSVMRDNVRAYNEYLNKVTATKMAQNEMRASNINNLISGLTGSVNSILGNIESRRATNNTLRAIAAANPNVDARLIGGFDYYIDPITKKKYNKNQQYVGTING